MDKIMIGDRVRWMSAMGFLRGEIVSIDLARNAKGDLIPWINVEYIHGNKTVLARLCGTESYLKMMKFQVNFRDAA